MEHKQGPKTILSDDENSYSTQHIKSFLGYLSVLICSVFFKKNLFPNCKALNLVQNGNFSILSLFLSAIFVTMATVKVE